jgi:hypothetical protein
VKVRICKGGLLHESALGDTPTPRASRQILRSKLSACMRHTLSIPAHAPLIAVEDGRIDDIRVLGPVPVRLVPRVGALSAQRGFVRPNVVAVPVHEVCSRVHRGRHVHVHDGEVVVAGFGAGIHADGELRGRFEDAVHGAEVLDAFGFGEVTAGEMLEGEMIRWCAVACYSFRTATVFLLQVEGRLVRPSESVPSRTLKAFSSACFCTTWRVRGWLLENGHADAPVRHRATTNALLSIVPAIMDNRQTYVGVSKVPSLITCL